MKIRANFVSNSSSSSFVINSSFLTDEQKKLLLDYQNSLDNLDNWDIYRVTDNLIKGFTCMDNGRFDNWLEKNGFNRLLFKFS